MLELEGTWEEILARSGELQGRKVRVLVLDQPANGDERLPDGVADQESLALLDEWERMPLTEEDRVTLDGLEEHLRAHPFSLRQVGDE